MKQLFLFIIALLSTVVGAGAQDKKPIDHSVYDSWESLGTISVPYNGRFLFYSVNQQEGDNILYMNDFVTGEKVTFPRVKSFVLSPDGKKLLYTISPLYQQVRDAKIKKKKLADMPKDTLVVYDINGGEQIVIPNLKSVKYGKELTSFIAYQFEEPSNKAKPEEKDSTVKSMPPKPKDAALPLIIYNIYTAECDTIKDVDKYTVSEDGSYLAYINKPDKKDSLAVCGLYLYNFETGKVKTLFEGDKKIRIDLPVFDKESSRIAFYAQPDTAASQKKFANIYYYDIAASGDKMADLLVSAQTPGLRQGWMIGDKHRMEFSTSESSFNETGGVLFFGTKPIPEEQDTTIAEFERVKLDIWRWNADYLPTVEAASKERFERLTYLAQISLADPSRMIQLADEQVPTIQIPEKLKGDVVFAATNKPYRIMVQWEVDPHSDIYKINVKTGARELIKTDARTSNLISSPFGNYYLYYDYIDRNWNQINTTDNSIKNITASLSVPFWNEDDDMPGAPDSYSSPIWMEDESSFLLGDRYDLWQFDPTYSKEPFMFTEGVGRLTNNNFSVVRPIHDPKATTIMGRSTGFQKCDEPVYLASFNRKSRESGFYIKDITKKKAKLTKLEEGPFTYSSLAVSFSNDYPGVDGLNKRIKKHRTPVYVYNKSNFENSPNVFTTKDLFKTSQVLSNTNPQQKDYNWGTVEMVSWMTDDSIRAEGLLYKPENFDPTKKYPMIIYFYEKDSDDLYKYKAPAPSRSIVNIPYFVSNGYIVFDPDIYYKDGHPGQCALRSILPAVDMLCLNSWVDEDNMAIQGQSWGGYQVAYMITQTNRFKAAGAGAPVSNMTSAYGGIRWGSGVTRQMQYEQGQSRIGKNLWDGFDLYYENSPLFFVPNVKTPVLIMHNDKDTAVPWYQGIEFFAALRRNGKQAWMVQYIGEDHNLRERHNAKDLSCKLAEFFDHFLKGAPEPEWMKVK